MSHLYNNPISKIKWFVRRFGAKELVLKPLRMVFGKMILPRLKAGKFYYGKSWYDNFYHLYNITWVGERMVEIPIIRGITLTYGSSGILEIGNVLSHYFPIKHYIIDKFEKAPGVENIDILEFNTVRKFDLIVSISTFEHIGFDDSDDGKGSGAKILAAINHCKSLLSDTGRLIITFPTGYNPELDEILKSNIFGATSIHCLKRVAMRNWQECDLKEALTFTYGSYFPYGNSVVVAEFAKE